MNYEKFFGLKDNPFRQSPDTDYFFNSNAHKELMQHLFYCMDSDDAFVEITGEPGIGKTITVRTFLNQIAGEKIKLSLIVNPKITPQDLLLSIALDFGMDEDMIEKASGEQLFRLFHKHLESLNQNEIVPLVIIDEAHSLSNEALEHLCLISNLETEKKHLVKIILLGQPILDQRLQDPVLKKIDNRITIRFHLKAMTKLETAHYVYHRLGIASESGTPPSLFSEQTINQIYRYSKGVPRIVNLLCERTLMAAFTENTRDINNLHTKKAYRSFQKKQSNFSHVMKKRIFVVSAAFMFLFASIYMIVSLMSSPNIPETNQKIRDLKQSENIEQKPEQTLRSNAVEMTPTQSSTLPEKPPQTTIEPEQPPQTTIKPEQPPQTTIKPEQNKSDTLIDDNNKKTEKIIKPQISAPEQSEKTALEPSQRMNIDKLPIQSLFTKNSYCIVVSPETNRMVVFQGKPDFNDLTSGHSGSFKLDEGLYFLNKDQSVAKTYTSSASEKSLTTAHLDLSANTISSNDLTMTQAITPSNHPNAFTENVQKELPLKELPQENESEQLPKDIAQDSEGEQLPSKKISQAAAVSITKVSPAQPTTSNVTENAKLKIKKSKQKSSQKKVKQPPEKPKKPETKEPEKADKNDFMLQEIISLPSDKRLAMISLETNQLTLWKGSSERPKLIKQIQMDFSGPEGIYILCKYKNKHVLFHPNDNNQLPAKYADELWQAIDPITNVTPVIVRFMHKKSYGPHTRQVKSFVNQWESAWQQKDLDAFMQLYVNDVIYFYKLNAPAIKLNWKILKSSQARIFSGNRQKVMHLSPTTYLIDPSNSNLAVAVFNQTYSDANYSEIGVMVLYLKNQIIGESKQKEWQIYGRMRIY